MDDPRPLGDDRAVRGKAVRPEHHEVAGLRRPRRCREVGRHEVEVARVSQMPPSRVRSRIEREVVDPHDEHRAVHSYARHVGLVVEGGTEPYLAAARQVRDTAVSVGGTESKPPYHSPFVWSSGSTKLANLS